MSDGGKIVIFDLDGTICDITHRLHWIKGDKKRWDKFFADCVKDEPKEDIIDIMKALYEHYIIWIFSGRSDVVRENTAEWLHANGVPYNFLKMRKEGDYTPDDMLKASWIDEFKLTPNQVVAIFDDRQRIVDMWRKKGFTCLQVAKGDF